MDRRIRVGAFVALGLLLATFSVFLIGDNRRLWDRKATFKASWVDVTGLRAGAPVRMSGIDVGSVASVGYSTDAADPRIHVTLAVARGESVRVRKDSVAKIVNKGLLGDKMVEITVGAAGQPEIGDGGTLMTEEPLDISKYIAKFESIANKTEQTVTNLERVTSALGEPELTNDIRATMRDIHEIFDGIAHQNGTLHKVIFDKATADRAERVLTHVEGMTRSLEKVSADMEDVSARVKTGPGTVHDVLYDPKLAAGAAGTLSELHRSLEAVRTGNGLAHAVVYGDDETQQILGNVNKMTGDLRDIVANVKAGKGTIGGLLVDPSVYEDIKVLVGNVERNQVLRALVRYSIKHNEEKAGGERNATAKPAAK